MFWADKQLMFSNLKLKKEIVYSHRKEVFHEWFGSCCVIPGGLYRCRSEGRCLTFQRSLQIVFSSIFDLYNQIKSEKSMIKNTNSNPYSTISASMRSELIELVQVQNYSIAQASGEVGIKLSTAKQILKRYRTTGTIYLRKEEKERTPKQEQNQTFPPRKPPTASIKNSGEMAAQTPQTIQSSHHSVSSGLETAFLHNYQVFMTPSGPMMFYFY